MTPEQIVAAAQQTTFLYIASTAAQVWSALLVFYVIFSREVVGDANAELAARWRRWADNMPGFHLYASKRVEQLQNLAKKGLVDEPAIIPIIAQIGEVTLPSPDDFFGATFEPNVFRKLWLWMDEANFFVRYAFESHELPEQLVPKVTQAIVTELAQKIRAADSVSSIRAWSIGVGAIVANLGFLVANGAFGFHQWFNWSLGLLNIGLLLTVGVEVAKALNPNFFAKDNE